ncbi:acyltransferase [Acidiphilium sp. PA]|uniref:acyltransferase family protein n=1 Tax=Acidiphilium sp. PA TaxID=2871705 RepID=UPI002244A408|nr:acyltransferase [Acidiphilium sp. PA]
MARFHFDSPRQTIGRLTRLDGLRGVLAVYVMLGHTAPFIPWPPTVGRVIEALVSHGLAAVNLFFALSGLVIVQSMARFGGRARAFLMARGWRLLPVYFVVLVLATVGLAWRSPFDVMPWVHAGNVEYQFWEGALPHPVFAHIVLHLALLQGLMPHGVLQGLEFSLLGPAWSLSTEWQFYVVIALVMPLVGSDDRGLRRLVWLCLAMAVAGRGYAAMMPLDWRFHRAFLPNEAAYFAIGIAAARLWRGGAGLLGFGAALVVASGIGASHGSGFSMIAKALPPLVWAVAVAAQRRPDHWLVRPIARALDHPAVLWLGAISYPLYLVNEPVGRALAVVVGGAAGGNPVWFSLMWGPLTLAGSIGVAAALHYTIERWCLDWAKARITPPAAVTPAVQSPGPAAV